MSRCSFAAQLQRFISDELPDEAREELEKHVDECGICQSELEQLASGEEQLIGSAWIRADQEHLDPGFVDRLLRSTPTRGGATDSASIPTKIGDYRILREIGRGGMGIVYEAEQLSLGRRVALKVLPGTSASDRAARERFQREAQATAAMHHTNIVPIFEVGSHEGIFFYAMQLIEGQSLDHLRKDMAQAVESYETIAEIIADKSNSRLRLLDVGGSSSVLQSSSKNRNRYFSLAQFAYQVADALAYAHRQGVIHRDIKPSNLLLDASGIVWITDFGLAKITNSELTHTGDLVGTLRYLSPERFRGDCDERADVYSLGITLYELLTLKPAFQDADRAKLIHSIFHIEPPRPRQIDPRIPRDLETIVLKATEKDASRRYQSAGRFSDDLRRFLDDQPIVARRASLVEQFVLWRRRNRGLANALAVLLLVLVGGIAATTWKWQEAEFQRSNAEQQSALATERLDEVLRLSDVQRLDDLLAEADRLWPAIPENVDALAAWVAEVEELVSNSKKDQQLLTSLRDQAEPYTKADADRDRQSHPLYERLKLLYLQRTMLLDTLTREQREHPLRFATVLADAPPGVPSPPSFYLRRSFTVEEPDHEIALDLEFVLDDGALVYLNGNELFRHNMPEGPIDHVTLADRIVYGTEDQVHNRKIGPIHLNAGLNVLAVEVHQAESLRNDARFDLSVKCGNLDLICRGAEWRYFDQGSLPANWNTLGFDDSNWLLGPAPLGVNFAQGPGKLLELNIEIAALEREISQRRTWTFNDPALHWQHASLSRYLERIQQLQSDDPARSVLASVRRRLEFASTVKHRTIEEFRDQWRRVCTSISDPNECPQYRGLTIQPQLGLIPLGRDPQSGLWEFAHLQTGHPPVRRNGKLVIDGETGIVFVLLPGGTFLMGAEQPILGCQLTRSNPADPDGLPVIGKIESESLAEQLHLNEGDHLASVNGIRVEEDAKFAAALIGLGAGDTARIDIIRKGAARQIAWEIPKNMDPYAHSMEGPITEVTLEPFFISKYEMTQGQWFRLASGEYNIATAKPSTVLDRSTINTKRPIRYASYNLSPENPVEAISWIEAMDVLERTCRLSLPSEAQWEYAARGGTSTVFWFGNNVADFGNAGNVADRFAYDTMDLRLWNYDLDVNDGHLAHAPVGLFRPNRFGIHDTVGNVAELCRDGYEAYGAQRQPGTGEVVRFDQQFVAVRGAAYRSPPMSNRSASRMGTYPQKSEPTVGVRPVRPIDK